MGYDLRDTNINLVSTDVTGLYPTSTRLSRGSTVIAALPFFSRSFETNLCRTV